MNKNLMALAMFGTLTALPAISHAAQTDVKTDEKVVLSETKQENDNPGKLRANFKRLGLEVTSTSVKNGDLYQNSPVSSLSSDSETLVSTVLDFALEYEKDKYRWDNSIYTKYGRKKSKTTTGKSKVDEKDDEIRFESDYTYKLWKYDNADIGPFANLGYQTEWTRNKNSDRTQIARGKTGIKLFNGKNFSNLYIAAVGEYDMTYETDIKKAAIEIGATAKFPVRDGVNFEVDGYYRNYVSHSDYIYEDFKYDLNLVGRMNVKITNTLTIAPFTSYRYAESRGAGKAGSNFTIGLSGLYTNIFNL